jgi:hypothetical protein
MKFVTDMLLGLRLKCLGFHGNHIERNVNIVRSGSEMEVRRLGDILNKWSLVA